MTSFESSFFLDTPHVRMHAFDRRPSLGAARAAVRPPLDAAPSAIDEDADGRDALGKAA
jgi:hypothetical protein